MDLAAHLRVIWRFRLLVLGGFVCAVALTVLATARVELGHGGPKLVYRKAEIWQSSARVMITQRGLPWGRTVLAIPGTAAAPPAGGTSQTFADPNRLASLASLYAQLVNGDDVQARLRLGSTDKVVAAPVADMTTGYATQLPILSIDATALSPGRAQSLAARAAAVFMRFIGSQQRRAGIPNGQRVRLELLNRPLRPLLLQGRKLTLPIVVFATVLIATLGLAFILENLRPLVRVVETDTARAGAEAVAAQRSA